MPALETVTFNGVRYRRYAGSPYFKPGIADKRKGARSLHEDIWIDANGPIPPGYNIHHRDGNALNNELANLRLMTIADHQALHTAERRASGAYRTPERLAHVERIRPLSKAWHASEEGRAWHAENGRRVIENLQTRDASCEQCGKGFQFRSIRIPRFCSKACSAAHRRASGIDNVQRQCQYCNAEFTVNRYSKVQTCNKVCAQRLRRAREAR